MFHAILKHMKRLKHLERVKHHDSPGRYRNAWNALSLTIYSWVSTLIVWSSSV